MRDMDLISIGEPVPMDLAAIGGPPIGARLTLTTERLMAVIHVDNMQKHERQAVQKGKIREHERQAVQKGKIRVGIMRYKDALYMLMKCGDALEFDLSYNVAVGDPEGTGMPPHEDNEGTGLYIIAYDSQTMITKALRAQSVSPKFSRIFAEQIAELRERQKQPDFDFQSSHNEAMSKYPNPTYMWKDAIHFETGGTSFEKKGKRLY